MIMVQNITDFDLPPLDTSLLFQYWTAETIPTEIFDQCYKLVRLIKSMYESSGMGWDPKSKKAEMLTEGMEYFVILKKVPPKGEKISYADNMTDGNTSSEISNMQVVAMLISLPNAPEFVDEDGNAIGPGKVTYIYELHVRKEHQQKGLGKYLLDLAKARSQWPKIALTVFRINKKAQDFYIRNGFKIIRETTLDSKLHRIKGWCEMEWQKQPIEQESK